MNEPTDAEKILLKVVDLQAKQRAWEKEKPLQAILYQIDSGELIGALVEDFGEVPHTYGEVKAFQEGAKRLWKALCQIEEAKQNAAVDADLAKLREEWTEL